MPIFFAPAAHFALKNTDFWLNSWIFTLSGFVTLRLSNIPTNEGGVPGEHKV